MANDVYSAQSLSDEVQAAVDNPVIRRIGTADILDALRRGWEDFKEHPTFAIFLVIIYPVVGLMLMRVTAGEEIFPILFPLMSGFALLGPFAAVGIYEISRRREAGLDATWGRAFGVVEHRSFGSVLTLGLGLMALFLAWLIVAWTIYDATLGSATFRSSEQFLKDVVSTPQGWALIAIGNGVGLIFAIVAFTISVVAFPYILDRHASAAQAVSVSIRAVATNPLTMMLWGLIIAVTLALGTIPFFIGLAIALPVLAHASWHLYRKVVV